MLTQGIKVFVHSPYDCILATKRDGSDRLKWLLDHERFDAAWSLLNEDSGVVNEHVENDSGLDTPSKANGSVTEFWEDGLSVNTVASACRDNRNASRQEKMRIGNLWVKQLVAQKEWGEAARTASKVLEKTSHWEHWIWAFAEAGKFDEITPFIPLRGVKPPLPSTVYELILAHYLETDVKKFEKLLEDWDMSLFDIDSITKSIRNKLDTGEVLPSTSQDGIVGRDWRVLLESLARLYLEGSMPVEALRCYLRTKNADAALHLVKKYRLQAALADRVYEFVTVNIGNDIINSRSASFDQLDTLSSDAVKLLAAGAEQHLVPISNVVQQLEPHSPKLSPFLFFYFRTMWNGDIPDDMDDRSSLAPSLSAPRRKRFDRNRATVTITASTRALLSPYIKLAVSLFAEYSRPLLGDLLKSCDNTGNGLSEEAGFYEHALAECENRNYIPELVSLLSATGQTSRALHLIIDRLGNVKQAINFVKDVDDEELWQDLLEYSMDKPNFIRGLLLEGGTSSDRLRPEDLVKRIPEGLEIPGLRDGLVAILRDSDIQSSIAEGAAQVSQSEVTSRLSELVQKRMKGIPFDVSSNDEAVVSKDKAYSSSIEFKTLHSRICAICTESLENSSTATAFEPRQDHLLAFHCGHIFHLECLLDYITSSENAAQISDLQRRLEEEDYAEDSQKVAWHRTSSKMSRARLIASVLGTIGCNICNK